MYESLVTHQKASTKTKEQLYASENKNEQYSKNYAIFQSAPFQGSPKWKG